MNKEPDYVERGFKATIAMLVAVIISPFITYLIGGIGAVFIGWLLIVVGTFVYLAYDPWKEPK